MKKSLDIEISIVIPCFHVGERIIKDLDTKIKNLDELNCNYELIIVLDGEDPQAEKLLTPWIKNKTTKTREIKLIKFAENQGKGFAVRAGMAVAVGKYIGYMDADNDIDPKILKEMYLTISNGDFDAVLPSKRHPKSEVVYPGNRKIFSTLYNIYVRKIVNLNLSDTQLGAKLYRNELIVATLPGLKLKGFIFELELLARAKASGFVKFVEIPVKVNLTTKSTIRFTNAWHIILETIGFTWEHKTGRLKKIENAKKQKY